MIFDRFERFGTWLGLLIAVYGWGFQYVSAREERAIFYPTNAEQGFFVCVLILLGVGAFVRIFVLSYPKIVPISKANKLMRDAISTKRTMVIHTKYISVADDPEFSKLIADLTREERRNIIFTVREETEKCHKIRELGLTVQILPKGFPELKSRFTIIDPDGPTERARIANVIEGNKVELYEIDPKSGHFFSFANDLRKVIKFIYFEYGNGKHHDNP